MFIHFSIDIRDGEDQMEKKNKKSPQPESSTDTLIALVDMTDQVNMKVFTKSKPICFKFHFSNFAFCER